MAKGKEVAQPMTRPRARKVTHIMSPPPSIVVEAPPNAGPSGAAKPPLFAEGAVSGTDAVVPLGMWSLSSDVNRLTEP